MSEAGFPLLSGPLPSISDLPANSTACRRCNKAFSVIFTRSRKCQHCSYQYCSPCSDYQALMPRYGTISAEAWTNLRTKGPVEYDVVNVCAFCSEFLQITAGGTDYLTSLPLTKLVEYANAYNIKIDHIVEKEDVIEAILSVRGPNGCLLPENERFYRKNSVPDRTAGGSARPRGLFSRSRANTRTRAISNPPPRSPSVHSCLDISRPDLESDPPTPSEQQDPTRPTPPEQQEPHSRPDLEPDPPQPTPPEQQEPHSNQYLYRRRSQYPGRPHTPHTPQSPLPPPPPPPPPRPDYSYHQSYSHPHYHSPPPPPPPPPPLPSRPEFHWGSPPYAHNNYHTSWGYPSQHDYYNYGVPPTYQFGYSSPHLPYPPPPQYPPPQYPPPKSPPPKNPPPKNPPPHSPTRPLPPHPGHQSYPEGSNNIPSSSQSANTQARAQLQRQLSLPILNAQPQSSTPPTLDPIPQSSTPPILDAWPQPPSSPTLDALLSMDPEDIRSLSILSLKALLFSNHVNFNATMVLKKSDLVERVLQLVENEKAARDRARRANEEEAEQTREADRESIQQEVEGEHAEHEHEREEHDQGEDDEAVADHNEEREGSLSPNLQSGSSSSPTLRTPSTKASFSHRNGLCVVCQEDEADIVIVDCGHLAMCRECSNDIMVASRQCPVCRTRIVAEERLLRIFKA